MCLYVARHGSQFLMKRLICLTKISKNLYFFFLKIIRSISISHSHAIFSEYATFISNRIVHTHCQTFKYLYSNFKLSSFVLLFIILNVFSFFEIPENTMSQGTDSWITFVSLCSAYIRQIQNVSLKQMFSRPFSWFNLLFYCFKMFCFFFFLFRLLCVDNWIVCQYRAIQKSNFNNYNNK